MAGLVCSLYESCLSVEQRLKVAQHVWRRGDLVASEKLPIMLRWSCQALCTAYNRKNKTPPPHVTCRRLWGLLREVVEALVRDGQVPDDLSPLNAHLFQGMGVVFSAAVAGDDNEEASCCVQTLHCLDNVLRLPQFPPALGVFEVLVALVESVLKVGVAFFSPSPRDPTLQHGVATVLECLLKLYVGLQDTFANKKKVFAGTCRQLLCPALQLSGLLQPGGVAPSSSNIVVGDVVVGNIVAGVDGVLRSLFRSDLLEEYSSALALPVSQHQQTKEEEEEGEEGEGEEGKKRKGRCAVSSTRLLFEVLEAGLTSGHCNDVISAIPSLFNAFLLQNKLAAKLPKSMEFSFFLRLLHLLWFHDDPSLLTQQHVQAPTSEALAGVVRKYWKRRRRRRGSGEELVHCKVAAVEQCLALVEREHVYQPTHDDNTADTSQHSSCTHTHTLSNLLQHIITMLRPHNVTVYCGCLCSLLRLDHRLLEAWLPMLWAILPSVQHQPKTCQLFSACIQTYARLRQVPLLLEKQLEATPLLAFQPVDLCTLPPPVLPLSCEQQLSGHLGNLPPGQALSSIQTHLRYCQQVFGQFDSHPAEEGRGWVVGVANSVQLFALLLSRCPQAVWTGRSKVEAMTSLHSLVELVEQSRLALKGNPAPSHAHQVSLLLLLSTCCELLLKLVPLLSPSTLPPSTLPPWPLRWTQLPGQQKLMLEPWVGVASSLHPAARLLMKRLCLLQWRWHAMREEEGEEEEEGREQRGVQQLLDSVFVADEGTSEPNASWHSQLFSVCEGNVGVACWSCILSHLPHLYPSCSPQHLKLVADLILSSFLLPAESAGEGEGVGLVGVVTVFLQSEAFLEMRQLHTLIFSQYLALVKKKGLPKPLRAVLKLCRASDSSEELLEAFPAVLSGALHYGLEVLTSSSLPHHHILLQRLKLPVFLKVLHSVPVSSCRGPLLLQALLMTQLHHIIAIQHLRNPQEEEEEEEGVCVASYLAPLSSVGAWLLQALLTTPTLKRKQKKALLCADVLGVWLAWHYQALLTPTRCLLGQEGLVAASSATALQLLLASHFSYHGYPQHFTTAVARDLVGAGKPVFLAGRVLLEVGEMLCGRGKVSESHTPCQYLCHLALDCLEEQAMAPVAVSSLAISPPLHTTHPHLLSLLATLLTFDPSLEHVRVSKVVDKIYTMATASMATNAPPRQEEEVLTKSVQFERLCGLLDLYTLRALLSQHLPSPAPSPAPSPTPPQAGVACGHGVAVLVAVWNEVLEVLETVLQQLQHQCQCVGRLISFLRDVAGRGRESREGGGGREEEEELLFSMALTKVCSVLTDILKLASAAGNTEEILDPVLKGLEGGGVARYCVCWCLLLRPKLPQSLHVALRPHYPKVLARCLALAQTHSTRSHTSHLVAMAIELAGHVISIPCQQLADSTILSSLQLCTLVTSWWAAREPHPHSMVHHEVVVVEGCLQLLVCVLRQHSAMIERNPAPLLIAITSLVRVVVELSQADHTPSPDHASSAPPPSIPGPTVLQCCSLLCRVLEMLSQHKALYQLFVPILHQFLTTSQLSPLPPHYKDAVLPGMFSVLKLLPPAEVAFLKACLEPVARDSLLTHLKHFNAAFKLGGRI